MAATEPTAGRVARAAGSVLHVFDRAREAIIEVAKSITGMIQAGAATQPDRVEVEFGLKFSTSGG
jgi:Trypsin-co-occurring domain 1